MENRSVETYYAMRWVCQCNGGAISGRLVASKGGRCRTDTESGRLRAGATTLFPRDERVAGPDCLGRERTASCSPPNTVSMQAHAHTKWENTCVEGIVGVSWIGNLTKMQKRGDKGRMLREISPYPCRCIRLLPSNCWTSIADCCCRLRWNHCPCFGCLG